MKTHKMKLKTNKKGERYIVYDSTKCYVDKQLETDNTLRLNCYTKIKVVNLNEEFIEFYEIYDT